AAVFLARELSPTRVARYRVEFLRTAARRSPVGCTQREIFAGGKFDQFYSLPRWTRQRVVPRCALRVICGEGHRDRRDRTPVLLLRLLGCTDGAGSGGLLRVTRAIAASACAGAVEADIGGADNANIGVPQTAHVDIDAERRAAARELIDIEGLCARLGR